jgi:hypothetical protein
MIAGGRVTLAEAVDHQIHHARVIDASDGLQRDAGEPRVGRCRGVEERVDALLGRFLLEEALERGAPHGDRGFANGALEVAYAQRAA